MSQIRTAVYIDGFNVYYRLKSTPYKWLDYRSLVNSLLPSNYSLNFLKYFTARINGRFDPDAPSRQDVYLRALIAHIPEMTIYEGSFLVTRKFTRLASNPSEYVEILNSEEKGSDVNLAVHLINDAHRNQYDVAFVMSNDTDLAEAIRLTRQIPGKRVGIIMPGDGQPATKLRSVASMVYRCRIGRMGQYQLPDRIPGTNIHKPASW